MINLNFLKKLKPKEMKNTHLKWDKSFSENNLRRYSYHYPFESDEPIDIRGRSIQDYSLPDLLNNHKRVLVACFPKSGSTFLTQIIANLPGMRKVSLYPVPVRRREQEIDLLRILQEEIISKHLRENGNKQGNLTEVIKYPDVGGGWVAQNHIRCSDITELITADYQISTIVLVRNIFDVLFSMRDHLNNSAVYMSMAYFDLPMRNMDKKDMLNFLIDMVAPWYINFYVGWYKNKKHLLVKYEDMRADPHSTLKKISKYIKITVRKKDIDMAISQINPNKTRMNKGIVGRGKAFNSYHRKKLKQYTSYYPDVDFSPIGL